MTRGMNPWLTFALAIVLVALGACSRNTDIAALREQIGDAPVVMLSTSTCGYCERRRADLDDWGVVFDDLDVESDQQGRRAYREVNGRGVPILVVGDAVLHGYSPEESRNLLLAANLIPER
jgi:glutaredoxin